MDDTLFGSDPAELTVIDEVAPCFGPVLYERFKSVAFDAVCEMGDSYADNFVTTADCEGLVEVLESDLKDLRCELSTNR